MPPFFSIVAMTATVETSSPIAPPAAAGAWLTASALTVADQAVVSGTRFAVALIVGRTCGADDLGILALGFSLLFLVAAVQDSLILRPFVVYGNRMDGQQLRTYTGGALLQYMAVAGLAGVVLAAVAGVFTAMAKLAPLAPMVGTLAGTVPGFLLAEFCRRVSLARVRARAALLLDSAVAVVQLSALLVLAWRGLLTPALAFGVTGGVSLLGGAAWLLASRRDLCFVAAALPDALRRNWRFGRWALAGAVIALVHGYALGWFLAVRFDTEATGRLSAAQQLVNLSNPFILSIGTVLGPRAVRALLLGGSWQLRRVVGRAAALLAAVLAAFCGGLALTGDQLFGLYRVSFPGQTATLVLLALGTLAAGVGAAATEGLYALERSDVDWKSNLVGLAMVAVAAPTLIVAWDLPGAAAAMLLGLVASAVVKWFVFLGASGRNRVLAAASVKS